MPRLKTVDTNEATGEIKELYGRIEKEMATVPNIFKGMAASPVLLKAYLQLDELIAGGTLSPVEQDAVRLVVSQFNGCRYCLAAHTKTGEMKGLSREEMKAIRRGTAEDDKQKALVTFVKRILDTKGFTTDEDIELFRDAGYTDAQAGEVITIIGQKMMSNYFNHVHDTELDFPEPEKA